MSAGVGEALRILVVDDEALARARLRTLIGNCEEPVARVAGEAPDAARALALSRRERFDVALVDIHMPGGDGLALAAALRELPDPPAVVFVTAHAEHALQAFDVEAVDYLTKPVRLERLAAALRKVRRRRPASPPADVPALLIQDRGRAERVPLDEVLYFKAELKYVTVRTAAREYILDGSLSEIEAAHPERFLRIHRNALVARRAMRALERQDDAEEGEGWAVLLSGVGERLAVSRRQLSAVRDALALP